MHAGDAADLAGGEAGASRWGRGAWTRPRASIRPCHRPGPTARLPPGPPFRHTARMPPSRAELARIQRLRELFLDEERGPAALRDYWRDPADLAAYDRVLAARIGWKWDAALAECRDRGFPRADSLRVLDFGCGTGIAARRFVAAFGAREVLCHDRSPLAMAFAADALRTESPGTAARACATVDDLACDVLLVSHVLGELDERGTAALRARIARAGCVVIVEPGSRVVARRLAALRDELLAEFNVVAPCPHAGKCPSLANDSDWCHFFAPPPPEVFTDGEWVRTAKEVGIDLRALPYAFVCLIRQELAGLGLVGVSAAPAHRLLGRPAITPRAATVQTCSAAGLTTRTIAKAEAPALWRALKKAGEGLRVVPEG